MDTRHIVVFALCGLSALNFAIAVAVLITGWGAGGSTFDLSWFHPTFKHHLWCLIVLAVLNFVIVMVVECFAVPLFGRHVTQLLIVHWILCACTGLVAWRAVSHNGKKDPRSHRAFGPATVMFVMIYSVTGFVVSLQLLYPPS